MPNSGEDWYPQSLSERVQFHINLDKEAPALAAKYGWDAATLAWIHADRVWIEHWSNKRNAIDFRRKQTTEYIAVISGNVKDVDVPATPDFTLEAAPAEVAPGIEARTRELRRETVGRSFYSKADGLLLGFEKPEAAPGDFSQIFPELNLRSLVNYAIEALFSKLGMDAVRFEYRYKNGAWQTLADKASSPATLNVPPQTPGEAVQIEIRAIFLRKYEPIGVYSPIYTITIAP